MSDSDFLRGFDQKALLQPMRLAGMQVLASQLSDDNPVTQI
jgi:hypothetical protein